jgi:hypothetical protein
MYRYPSPAASAVTFFDGSPTVVFVQRADARSNTKRPRSRLPA